MSRYQREHSKTKKFQDDKDRKSPQRFRRQPDQIERNLTVSDLIRMPFMEVIRILISASNHEGKSFGPSPQRDRGVHRRRDDRDRKNWNQQVSNSYRDERREYKGNSNNREYNKNKSWQSDKNKNHHQQGQGWVEQTNQGWGIENSDQGQDKQKNDTISIKPEKYQNQKEIIKY